MKKEQIKQELKRRLPEYFDSYFLVGVVADVEAITGNNPFNSPQIVICGKAISMQQAKVVHDTIKACMKDGITR